MPSVEPPDRVVLRPAGVADLPLIYRAERDYMRDVEPAGEAGWTRATDRNLQLWIDNLATTTVLELDGEAVGFVMWRAEPSGAALVITVQVLPPFRRRGLGRRLLDVVTEQARAQGIRSVTLGVHRDNPAVGLYEAAGFLPTGTDGEYLLYARGRLRHRLAVTGADPRASLAHRERGRERSVTWSVRSPRALSGR